MKKKQQLDYEISIIYELIMIILFQAMLSIDMTLLTMDARNKYICLSKIVIL